MQQPCTRLAALCASLAVQPEYTFIFCSGRLKQLGLLVGPVQVSEHQPQLTGVRMLVTGLLVLQRVEMLLRIGVRHRLVGKIGLNFFL